jgi:flagellar hook assembly protein FlgD
VAVNGLSQELELGRVALAPAAPLAAWPLPYRGGTLNVSFTLFGGLGAVGGSAEIRLFDLSGRLVRLLADGPFTDGHPLITWDGRDERGVPVPDGIYFLRAASAGVSHRLKIVVIQKGR